MSNANAAEIMVGTYTEERSRLHTAVGQIAVSPHVVHEIPWQRISIYKGIDYYTTRLVNNVRVWLTGTCGFSGDEVNSVVRHDGDIRVWYAQGVAPQGYELYVKGADLPLENEFGVTPRMANARIVDGRAAYDWELLDFDGVTQQASLELLPVVAYDKVMLLADVLAGQQVYATAYDALMTLTGKIDSRFSGWRKWVMDSGRLDDSQKAMLLGIPEQIQASKLFGSHMLNRTVQAEDLARAANVLQVYQPSPGM